MNDHKQNKDTPRAHGPDSDRTRSRIQRLVTLPPLPRRSQELLQLLSDPNLNILAVVEVVEQTPALAARILGVAGSPFFASPMPARTVSDAIIRLLGLNLVRDLSLSLILSQSFNVRRCRAFKPLRYWQHAVATAVLGQMLAPLVTSVAAPAGSDAYLGGLLHSLGLLALTDVSPEAMDLVFKEAEANPPCSLSGVERLLLGLDHAMAGAEVARSWHLPSPIAAAMAHHRNLDYRGEHWPLVAVVALADRASKARLATDTVDSDIADLSSLLDVLGIHRSGWQRVLGRWLERIDRIDGLATVLAGEPS